MRIPLLGLATLGLLSCSTSTDNGPPPATPADVVIVPGASGEGANAYSPNPLTFSLAAKQSVKWRNSDNIDHTVTGDMGEFDSGVVGGAGTFSFTFLAEGTYAYHCTIHPSMVGTIVVDP